MYAFHLFLYQCNIAIYRIYSTAALHYLKNNFTIKEQKPLRLKIQVSKISPVWSAWQTAILQII